MYGIDQYYIILVLPALILSIFAQFKVKSTFNNTAVSEIQAV